jgi:hypothetical protein
MLESFRTLGEPNRLQIVDLLFKGPLPVGPVVAQRRIDALRWEVQFQRLDQVLEEV